MFFYTTVFVALLAVPVVLTIDTTTPAEDGSTEASASANCTDAIGNCAQYVNTLCKRTEYSIVMYKQCRSTCGMCSLTSEPCIDNQKACSKWNAKGYCASTFYTTKQKKDNCAATCNLCTAAAGATGCVDVNHNCANWNLKGFCTSATYDAATKKANCAATCKLC